MRIAALLGHLTGMRGGTSATAAAEQEPKVADDDTTVVELVKALGESVTFSEGLLDLAEVLLLRLENDERPSPDQRMHLRTGMVRWRAGSRDCASGWLVSVSSSPLVRSEQGLAVGSGQV
jgi:hypothetical protein